MKQKQENIKKQEDTEHIQGHVVVNEYPGRHIIIKVDLGTTLKNRRKNWKRLQDFVKGL